MGTLAGLLYGLFLIAIGIILIYLIVRRIQTNETEDFDKRDN